MCTLSWFCLTPSATCPSPSLPLLELDTRVSVAPARGCLLLPTNACLALFPRPTSVTQLGLAMLTALPQEFAATGSFPASSVSMPA